MGCLKLTYQTTETPLKVVYKKPSFEQNNAQRFMRIDPKPSASWSPYATMSDNPIIYTDVLGDVVKPANKSSLNTFRQVLSSFTKKGTFKQAQKLFGVEQTNTSFTSGVHKRGIKSFSQPVFTISKKFSYNKFSKRLKKSGLSKEKMKQATAIFQLLKSKDIVELGITKNSAMKSKIDYKPISGIVTVGDNPQFNSLLNKIRLGTGVGDVQQTLRNAPISGKAGSGVYGFFPENSAGIQNSYLIGNLQIDVRTPASVAQFGNSNSSLSQKKVNNAVSSGISNFIKKNSNK